MYIRLKTYFCSVLVHIVQCALFNKHVSFMESGNLVYLILNILLLESEITYQRGLLFGITLNETINIYMQPRI